MSHQGSLLYWLFKVAYLLKILRKSSRHYNMQSHHSLFRIILYHYRLNVQTLLLLSHFSHVWLCATPQTAAHQAPPSLGFSRQEHWSGLPFPSPMHESEKWKWSGLVMSDSSRPHGLQPTRLLRPWDFPGKSTGVGKWKLKVKWLSHVRLFTTPWTAAYQAPSSMGFSRQEYWSGFPLPSPKYKRYSIVIFIYPNSLWYNFISIYVITTIVYCWYLCSKQL